MGQALKGKDNSVIPGRLVPPPPHGWRNWESLMDEALVEAAASGRAGEIPVGAIVVSGHGELLSRSGNRVETLRDPTAHAEMLAVRAACARARNYRLEGAILVTTLEPCLMCAGALAHTRLAGLVYGVRDARAGAVISCYDGLDQPFLNHRVWHMGNIREEECTRMLHMFFRSRR